MPIDEQPAASTLPRPRYVVRSTTGCTIRPAATFPSGSTSPLPTGYYVLDRWYCWRVAASSDVAPKGGGGSNFSRRILAEAKADELNAL